MFPEDREILRRARAFGNCSLAGELWRELGLEGFWQQRLSEGHEEVSWEKVLRLLVVNRWIEPGSEFRVHRHWFLGSAMDELLDVVQNGGNNIATREAVPGPAPVGAVGRSAGRGITEAGRRVMDRV